MNYENLIGASNIRVITTESDGYDDTRAVYNAMIDKRRIVSAIRKSSSCFGKNIHKMSSSSRKI
jgi:hypothetical protein